MDPRRLVDSVSPAGHAPGERVTWKVSRPEENSPRMWALQGVAGKERPSDLNVSGDHEAVSFYARASGA